MPRVRFATSTARIWLRAVAPLLADESWWTRSAVKETLEAYPDDALERVASYLNHPDQFARNGAAEVLQNTGALDALIARVAADPDRTKTRSTRAALWQPVGND